MLKFNSALRILVFGYGNPDWLDEGVGPALAEAVGRLNLAGVTVDWSDDLDLEAAVTLAACDIVVFAGGTLKGTEPFAFKPIRVGAARPGVRRRAFDPAELLRVTGKLFGRKPEGYELAIRGYEFGPGQELSGGAKANLQKALDFLEAAIRLRLAA